MSLSDRLSAELGDPPDAVDHDAAMLEDAVFMDLDSDEYDEFEVAALYGITVEKVREICGRQGHTWETFDYYVSEVVPTIVCMRCGAPRSDDEPYGMEFEP